MTDSSAPFMRHARPALAPASASHAPRARLLQRITALCTGLIGAAFLVAGAGMASAGLADDQTRAFLADWEAKLAAPSAAAWNVASNAARRAVAYHPVANGPYLERLGYVHAWQHFGQPQAAPSAQASRQAARDAYRAAIQARPHWPYAWTALAQIKLELREFDAEFRRALLQAQHLAPWRTDINRRVAEVGLIAWTQIDGPQHALVLDAAARAIGYSSRHRAPLFALAAHAGQTRVLCSRLRTQGLPTRTQDCPADPAPTSAASRSTAVR